MIRHEIEKLIADAVRAAQAAGEIPAGGATEPLVERPQRPEHGDYASSLPLRLARAARMNPMDLAQIIARRTAAGGAIASVETAPPGFVNVRLSSPWLAAQVDEVLREGAAFGDVPLGQGKRVQVEFVSANPVGPIHVGNGRGLALGDTLARVHEAAGFEVQREYLVNDAGTQTEAFASTLYARYQQLFGRDIAIPEGGYPGEYMVELAQQLKEAKGDSLLRRRTNPIRRSCTTSASRRWSKRSIAIWLQSALSMTTGSRSVRCTGTARTKRQWRCSANVIALRSEKARSGSPHPPSVRRRTTSSSGHQARPHTSLPTSPTTTISSCCEASTAWWTFGEPTTRATCPE